MAGTKLVVKPTVAASTILEVVISMVMIIVVFGIAMMIFTNVTRMSLSVKKIKAEAVLRDTLIRTEQQLKPGKDTFQSDDLRIEQEVKHSEGNGQLLEIHLTAFDLNQQKVAELHKILAQP